MNNFKKFTVMKENKRTVLSDNTMPLNIQREIKFRAWNRIVERMQHFSLPDIELQKGKIQWQNIEVMQYTGLKDKSGKDWYAGDIGDADEPPANSIAARTGLRYFEIVWDEKYAAFGAKQADGTISEITADWMAECENIGNIYENPELIK